MKYGAHPYNTTMSVNLLPISTDRGMALVRVSCFLCGDHLSDMHGLFTSRELDHQWKLHVRNDTAAEE